MKLRDYQQEAFNKVIASKEHTLVVSPCGSGKSLIMSELVNYFSSNGKKVLVLGSEGFGISSKIIKKCDECVGIAMKNNFDSLNVSAAFAILCDRMLNA